MSGWAEGAGRSGRRRLNLVSCSECTLSSAGGKMPDWGDLAAFKTTVVHLVREGYLMLLAPVLTATPSFSPYRFRIYLACIIVILIL